MEPAPVTAQLRRLAADGSLTRPRLRELIAAGKLSKTSLAQLETLGQVGPAWQLDTEGQLQMWPVDVREDGRLLPTVNPDGQATLAWWVPFGDEFEIPAGFEYQGAGSFEWVLWVHVVDGVAECLAVKASAGDRPITAAMMRELPLGRLVHEAVVRASRPADEIPKRLLLWASVEEAKRQRQAVTVAYRERKRSPRDRQRVTEETLREVAEIYRSAIAGGAPTREVAERLSYSRASAGRLVFKARERGFLPKTDERRARA